MSAKSSVKKLALLTGGGDCPGLNSAIRAVVQSAVLEYGITVVGVPDGFKGLLENKFDIIYHEHVFYYSLIALQNLYKTAMKLDRISLV